MKSTTPLPGILQVQATDTVSVSYDAALNLVEIIKDNRIIRTEVAPRMYTAKQFITTLQRVRQYYTQS